MFKTERTVYRTKEGIYDLIDENNINVVSGCLPFTNKKQKLQIWKQLKQEFQDNVQILIQDQIISYSANVPRNYF
jgi:hypothetical protein